MERLYPSTTPASSSENQNNVTPVIELGTDSGTSKGGISADEVTAIVAARRGRKPKAISAAEDEKAARERILQEKRAKIYTAENWGPVAGIPGNILAAVTGYPDFKLDSEEKARLGALTAEVAELLEWIDPKYAAVTLLCVNAADVYGTKAVQFALWKRSQPKAQKKEDQRPDSFQTPLKSEQ